MKKRFKKITLIILPVALGVFLIWWSLSALSESDKLEIKNALKNVNYFWVFISLFLGLLSHLSRAYRWKFLLAPLGYKIHFINGVFTVFIAYLINLVIPRAGEIARATAISKYESIPFEKAFGTIVVERIVDVIMLLLIIVIAFFYQFDLLKDLIHNSKRNNICIKEMGVVSEIHHPSAGETLGVVSEIHYPSAGDTPYKDLINNTCFNNIQSINHQDVIDGYDNTNYKEMVLDNIDYSSLKAKYPNIYEVLKMDSILQNSYGKKDLENCKMQKKF